MILQSINLKKSTYIAIPLKLVKFSGIYLLLVIIFDLLLFPLPILAAEAESTNIVDIVDKVIEINTNNSQKNFLPESLEVTVKRTGFYDMTAYNSLPGQTDNSPCITANGFDVCEHGIEDTVAANFLPFGTRIRIPELFGDRIFIVRDRMNRRYTERIDIWMINYSDAIKFGKKVVKIEILD